MFSYLEAPFDLMRLAGTCRYLRGLLSERCAPWTALKETAREHQHKSARGYGQLNITLIGPQYVGKTTTLIVYTTNGVPQTYLPSPESYSASVMLDGCPVRLEIRDTHSIVSLKYIQREEWATTDIFMACFDRTRPSSVSELQHHVRFARFVCGNKVPILFVGIKDPTFMAGHRNDYDFRQLERQALEKVRELWKREPILIGSFQTGLKSAFDAAMREAFESKVPQKEKTKCTLQ